MGSLQIRGAQENNLRSVDLDLPLGLWTAVTGPSGSGKTSLVFGTLVAEGQRRFLGSLSPKARQALGKLGRARLSGLAGLPPAVAPGAGELRQAPRSTVGTLLGGMDLLRLLYAREGSDPEGVRDGPPLARSQFSFNHPRGACEACDGSGVQDRVDPELLVADAGKGLRDGALVPTLKNGYTVYSQVTAQVMESICAAHGFDMQTPWRDLEQAQRDVILYGTKALKVPFGKHSIESRMRWEGITARPREEGYYRGLVPVIEETLQRSRNPGVLRFVRSAPCGSCAGTRLGPVGRRVLVGGLSLPELLALDATGLRDTLDGLPASPVLSAVRPGLGQRLERMVRLGLGHLALARPAGTLSTGEARRLALAAQLTAGLGGMLVAIDEATAGLHPSEQQGLGEVLEDVLALGNTLVLVEHDPDMVRWADHLVRVGPGSGSRGGQVIEFGSVPPDPLPVQAPPRRPARGRSSGELVLRGARLHNLRGAELRLELGALNVVLGPSGSGKSTLVFGTLLPALAGEPADCDGLSGAPAGGVAASDARPIGRNPRSTPATWTGLFDVLRKRFAATEDAKAAGLKAGDFSYNNKGGRCPACEGLGVERIGMHLLEDLERTCPACSGGRYAGEVLDVRWRGLTIAQALALDVDRALEAFAGDAQLEATVRAMHDLGLGYLPLGQGSQTLSRGESQRIKLARLLADSRSASSVVLLDEPDRGLHPSDVAQLLGSLSRLVEAGHTVVAISHHRALWEAADRCIEVRAGEARVLPAAPPPVVSRPASEARQPRLPESIELRGARAHNLRGIDVSFPHGAITAVCGVSGSGKSSLAFHTLAAEAWCRFAESLPFQVRRFVRRQPRPELESASGLTPVLRLEQGGADHDPGPRSTVATASEIGPLLRLLWSRAGHIGGEPCGLGAEHFSTARALGACPACEGHGEVQRCRPELLITDPSRALGDGALAGTRAGRYLGEPGGQFLATLRAALEAGGGLGSELDRPWSQMSPPAQRIALEGSGDETFAVTWSFERGGRAGEHSFEGPWPGLLVLAEREAARRMKQKAAAEWAAALGPTACADCGDSGLGQAARAVQLGALDLPAALALPLMELPGALAKAKLDGRQREVLQALESELQGRVDDLVNLGLGGIALGRRTRSLSGGERARLRLAGVLHGGLTGVTLVLDEPAAGLGGADVTRMMAVLRRLTQRGNTVVLVEHRPEVLRAADWLVELGPGAGPDGGELLAAGPAAEFLAGASPTARMLRGAANLRAPLPAEPAGAVLRGVKCGPLQGVDIAFPSTGLVAMTGPSGSGKSSLLWGVLEPSLREGRPIGCEALEGFERFGARALSGPGRTVLTSLGLGAGVQALFHAAAKGAKAGLPAAAFALGGAKGRCQACRGKGIEAVALDGLGDLELPCPECGGARFRPEVLEVRWKGWNVAEFLGLSASSLIAELPPDPRWQALRALVEAGAGHVAPGRRSSTLSGGEAQRVALAGAVAALAGGDIGPQVLLLDGPASGLHEADLPALVALLDRLVEAGWLVLMAEQRPSLVGAAAHVVRLGPGGE